MSCNQTLIDGGWGDFHSNRILLRAIREAKAITLFWIPVVCRLSGGLPNIAICGVGIRFMSNTSEIILKNRCQNSDSLGHAQSMWVRLHGVYESIAFIIKSVRIKF